MECARLVEEEAAFSDLYITGVEFAGEVEGRELGRGFNGVVYEVMWRGTPCAAKKIHPSLLESVPGEWFIRKPPFNQWMGHINNSNRAHQIYSTVISLIYALVVR